ncbi:MAG: zinc-binding dehydrogenase [Acetivibrionales bacterium]|jgi:threonine 3-dehydrogenase
MKKTMYGVYKAEAAPNAIIKEDLPIPEVGERDILVNVKATAICGTDLHIMAWNDYAQKRVPVPMVFGHEFAGEVVEIGSKVTEVKVGDRVAGETHIPCNNCYQCETDNRHICENMKIIGVHVPGSFAEYISFPVDCAYKIGDLDYKLGAVLEPMGVAVHGVDKAEVAGKVVVINGCGPIGLLAVGATKAWGAKKIIALDVVDEKLNVATTMGASVTINSLKSDAIAEVHKATGHGADVVIDYTGNLKAIKSGFDMLRKGGRYVLVGLPTGKFEIDLTEDIIYKEATVIGVTGRLMYKTWDQCMELLKSDKFNIEPAISGTYPLSEYEKAFADIKAGVPGKMILIP